MKHKFIAFMDSLILYDYILFGSIFLLFFILILLALLLRAKPRISLFLVISSFLFLFIAPFVGYIQMHNYIFKKELSVVKQKKLQFTKAVIVWGQLKNSSQRDFQSCKITAIFHKASKNKYKNYIYSFKLIQQMSIIKKDITQGSKIDFKIIVDPFTYTKAYNIKLKADCR